MTAPTIPPPTRQPQRQPAPGRGEQHVGRLLFGSVLIMLGALWLIDLTGAFDLNGQIVLSSVVMAIGIMLLLTARVGGHDGLTFLGVVLSILLVVTSTMPTMPLLSGVGEREAAPAAVTDLQPAYELGMGPLALDLADLAMAAGESATVSASVGMGELVVDLPSDATVQVHATSGVGEVSVLGRTQNGLGVEMDEFIVGSEGGGRLILELSVGMGAIEVRR